jgi:Uma2 family endonuclease
MAATVVPAKSEPNALLLVDNDLYEVIAGETLAVAPSSYDHSRFGLRLGGRLEVFATDNDLGEVVGSDIGILFRETPRLMLGPDAAFVAKDRLPPDWDRSKFLRVVPDLVVEVISPTDTQREVAANVAIYLELGVQLVWLADPEAKTVTVYRAGREPRILTAADTLDGEDVVPGFRLPVSLVFR